MAKRPVEKKVEEDPRYHDTWRLLKKYRDVVWSLELSVQQLKKQFEVEYGSSIEDFLESVYLAGADLGGTEIENHARCIERSHKMLSLLNHSVDLLRTRHKNGEEFYWILYFTYLSPQQLKNAEEIIEQLRPHIAGHQFPHLLPQAQKGGGGPQFHPLGIYLPGVPAGPGAVLPIRRRKVTERNPVTSGIMTPCTG